jgi:hypothetical protein
MEYLARYLEPVAIAKHGSLVFRCERPIPATELAKTFGGFSSEERIGLMDRAIERVSAFVASIPGQTDIDRRYRLGILHIAKARLMLAEVNAAAAMAAIDAARRLDAEPALQAAAALIDIVSNYAPAASIPFQET